MVYPWAFKNNNNSNFKRNIMRRSMMSNIKLTQGFTTDDNIYSWEYDKDGRELKIWDENKTVTLRGVVSQTINKKINEFIENDSLGGLTGVIKGVLEIDIEEKVVDTEITLPEYDKGYYEYEYEYEYVHDNKLLKIRRYKDGGGFSIVTIPDEDDNMCYTIAWINSLNPCVSGEYMQRFLCMLYKKNEINIIHE